jgi:hypothetical protein
MSYIITVKMGSMRKAKAEYKEKQGVWDPMTIISPYVRSRVDFKTFTMGNLMPEAILTLC